MTNEMSNVPELRFPEFDGEWEEKMLGEVTIYKNGGSFENSVKNHGVFNLITLKSVNTEGELINSGKYIDDKSTETLCKGTLVMILSEQAPGLVGMTANITRNNKYVLNQRVAALVPKQGIDSQFLSKLINRNQKYFSVRSAGTKVKNISKGHVENFNFLAPNYTEQQKIGNFFSKLDRQIELEEQKLSLLEEQKKGYMQKVFSQELRFKDENGNNYPEWEEKELGDVATIVGGGTPNTKIAEYWNGDINWFSPVEIGNDIFVNESKSKITELGLKKSSAKLLPTGTVLFTSRAGIGKTAILNSEACTNQGFQSIVPNQSMLDSYYIYSRTNQLKKYAEIVGSGSTFIEVSGVQMRKMPIMLPSITEQEKIGVFFKKIDDSLKKQSDKIGLLKERKKGFLQKMFV